MLDGVPQAGYRYPLPGIILVVRTVSERLGRCK